ncbi:MAG TPA: DUF2171 domain-containing protein [Gaiellaceae bacterium]|nr:DUF2171 domain-containing protein [Gaiellaceae bacterium]
MSDPVSWLLIEPGWRVVAADGEEVGRVEEVTGDSNADIFDGLAISFSMLGAQRYVPSEQVGTITEGTVQLRLDRAAIDQLPKFDEPEQEMIEPEKAPVGARAEQRILGSTPKTHGLRRVLEWFGLAGRR